MKPTILIKKVASALLLAALICVFWAPQAALAANKSDDFYTNAVFLGDSLTVGLSDYVDIARRTDPNFLSNAQFLAMSSYGIRSSLQDDGYSLHPYYNGRQLQPQKAIAQMKVSKVFIMLGINDIKENMDETIEGYKTLIGRIQSACSGIDIYVQSVLPMTSSKEDGSISNSRISTFNSKLKNMCASLSLTYVDICGSFKNSNGSMNSVYSSDDYVHMNNAGYETWVAALREYASNKLIQVQVCNVETCANVRSGPSLEDERVARLYNGTNVYLLEAFIKGEWHKIETESGKIGYIRKDFLDLSALNLVRLRGTIIKVASTVNARVLPNTTCDIAFEIPKGAVVEVLPEYSADNWYLVLYNKQYVYVRQDFISIQ